MREIKFRVWSVLATRMINWGNIFHLPAWEIFSGTPEQRPFNVMQYTGCKDKNGVEIYEGDILSFKSAHSDYAYKTIGEVVWYCGEAAFLVECDGEIFKHFDEIREIEVLGNIYENPEILKDSK